MINHKKAAYGANVSDGLGEALDCAFFVNMWDSFSSISNPANDLYNYINCF